MSTDATMVQASATEVAAGGESTAAAETEKQVSTATASSEELGKILEQKSEAETQTPAGETTEAKPDTAATAVPVDPAEFEKLKKENETLGKQVADKEAYIRNRQSIIDRQSTILRQAGLLDQKAQALRAKAEETASPGEAATLVYHAEKAQAEADQLKAQHQWTENKEAILNYVPDYESLIPDIVEICREKGYREDLIEAYKNAPYNEPLPLVISMADAAKSRRAIRERDEQLKAKEEKLKILQTNPDQIAKKIAQAAASTPGITAASGGASGTEALSVTPGMIHTMSKAQLEEFLKTK